MTESPDPRSRQHRGHLQSRSPGAEGRVARRCRRAGSSRCSAPTAPARRRRLKAISNLLRAERGEVTKGAILFEGERVDRLSPNELVRRGAIQVMEGRHCFGHLTIEENLLTGAFTRRDGRAAVARDLERGLQYFPAPEGAPHALSRLHLGRRAADVRDRPGDDGAARS